MATRADVEEFAQANRDIRALLLVALVQWWRSLTFADPKAVAAEAVQTMPGLVGTYGELAASLAADFYDRLREQSGAPGRYLAEMADPAPVEAVQANTRWAVGPLFTTAEQPEPDPDGALARLEQVADAAVQQQGRDTIDLSTGRDPADARWARVPTGRSTCAFCLVLASRGPVYRSGDSAGAAKKFHAGDDCQAVPIWPGDPLPEGYDPDALYQSYADARRQARSGDLKPILAAMRRQGGVTH